MVSFDNQPNWGDIADKFDVWLPHLAPVGEALLQSLNTQAGDKVLDVGSGTGEPALTLARALDGDVDITGIDAAEGMVNVAQQKVLEQKLEGVHFEAMQAAVLRYPDDYFDRLLCQFGVMLFEFPLQGLKEMHRVLKPGGQYSLAVWSTAETMRTLYWSYEVFKYKIQSEFHPPLAKVTALGDSGAMEQLLMEAGYKNFSIETRTIYYQFESFEDYWGVIEASEILKVQFKALPETERGIVREQFSRLASEYIVDGKLRIPHDYLLVSGNK